MSKRFFILSFGMIVFAVSAWSQADTVFVLPAEVTGTTALTDSTFSVTATHAADQLGQAYLPTAILPGYRLFDGFGRLYRVDSVNDATLNSSTLYVTELQDGLAPAGAGMVYRKQTYSECIPVVPMANSNVSPATLARIFNHNAVNGCTDVSGLGGSGSVDSALYVTITRLADSTAAVRADFPSVISKLDTAVVASLNDSTFVAHNYVGGSIVRSDTITISGTGGSSLWTEDGSGITYFDGNVKIGDDLGENLIIGNGVFASNRSTQLNPSLFLFSGLSNSYGIKLHQSIDNRFGTMIFAPRNNGRGIFFGSSPVTGTSISDVDFEEFARFSAETGFLGINTTAPNAYLTIKSTSATNPALRLTQENTSNAALSVDFNRTGTNVQSNFNWSTNLVAKWNLGQDNDATEDLKLYDWVKGSYIMKWISGSGNIAYGLFSGSGVPTNFYIDNSNEKIGIGTSTPQYLLTMGDAAGDAAAMRLFPHTSTPTGALGVQWVHSGGYYLDHNDTEYLRRVLMENAAPTDGDLLTYDSANSRFNHRNPYARSYTPTATGDSNGDEGDIAYDDDYIYIKTSAGWKRAALSTF